MKAFELIRRAIDEHAFSGAQIAVAQSGVITHSEGFGTTDRSGTYRVSTDTRFDFASVTKPFVAVVMMRLFAEDIVHPSSLVREIIPELDGSPHGPLQLSQLLEHSSGQPRRFSRVIEARAAMDLRNSSSQPTLPERQYRVRELLKDLRTVPLLFSPGTRVAYTSLGYFLLGVVVERVSGRMLDEFMSEALLRPLGLSTVEYRPDPAASTFAVTETCPWRNRLLRGEVHDEIAAYVGGVTGHAGLFGTACDLASFGNAVLDPSDIPVPGPWVRASYRSRTHHLTGENRSWGWLLNTPGSFMGHLASSRAFGHTGFTGTSLFVEPELSLVVALLTNRVHPTRENEAINVLRPSIHDAVIAELG